MENILYYDEIIVIDKEFLTITPILCVFFYLRFVLLKMAEQQLSLVLNSRLV